MSENFGIIRDYLIGHDDGRHGKARFLIEMTINNAQLDLCNGVNDAGFGKEERIIKRTDALLYFVDGRYERHLKLTGRFLEDAGLPVGVGDWIKAIANWARNMPGASPVMHDYDAVKWAANQGHLEDERNWDAASRFFETVYKKYPRRNLGG